MQTPAQTSGTVILGTWPPEWAQIRGADGKPTGELDVAAFRRHIRECVTHFRNVRLFESWNEISLPGSVTNTQELMWAATDECKQARPDAIMMTNAVTGPPAGWLKAWLNVRRGRPLDAVSLHYPWDSLRDSPERGHMRDTLALTRRLAEASGGEGRAAVHHRERIPRRGRLACAGHGGHGS